jgi:hypothetical protein
MNIYELQHRFNLEVEKYGIVDPVMSTIIEDYINYAYQYYITEKYDSLINPVEKFEVTERISRILAPLLKDFTTVGPGTLIQTNSDYGFYVTAPIDLQYIIKDVAVISYTNCNGVIDTKVCSVIPIKHHMISTNLKNPFLKPENDEIWRVNFSDRKIELILYDGVILSSYTCRYLKKQLPVSFNPVAPLDGTMEIDSSVHEEVVLRAVQLYLSDLRNNNKKENV